MKEFFLTYLQEFGILAVFIYSFLESSLLIPITPGEIFLLSIAIGFMVVDIPTYLVFVVALTGATVFGNVFVYYFSREYGREFIEWVFNKLGISISHINTMENYFERYGEYVVLWGRFIPYVRAYISIAAGLARMDFRRYFIYTTIGATLFNLVFVGLTWRGVEMVRIYREAPTVAVADVSLPVSSAAGVFLTLIIGGIFVSFFRSNQYLNI